MTGDAHAKPAAESSPGSGQRTFGWIALGVGAAGIGVGTVTGLLALSKRSSIEEFCDDTECLPPAHEDVDSYNSLRTISTIGFIAGFVAAGAGVTLLLTAPSESAPSAGGERRKVPGRVALWLGPGAVGVRGTIE